MKKGNLLIMSLAVASAILIGPPGYNAAATEKSADEIRMELMEAMREKDTDEKIEALEKFIEDHSDSVFTGSAYIQLGVTYEEAGEQEKAKKIWEKAAELEMENRSPDFLNILAYKLAETEIRLDRAEKMAKKAVEMIGNLQSSGGAGMDAGQFEAIKAQRLAQIKDTLSLVYMKQGENQKALEILEELMEDFSHIPELRMKLARLYHEMDRYEDAWKTGKLLLAPKEDLTEEREAFLREVYKSAHGGNEAGFDEAVSDAEKALEEQKLQVLKDSLIDEEPPRVTLDMLDGKTKKKLSDYKGKVLFLNMWATWCKPCHIELPKFEEAYEKLKSKGDIEFLALSVDRESVKLKIKDFMSKKSLDLPLAHSSEAMVKFQLQGIPSMIVLDKKGRVRYKGTGFDPREDFTEKIKSLYNLVK